MSALSNVHLTGCRAYCDRVLCPTTLGDSNMVPLHGVIRSRGSWSRHRYVKLRKRGRAPTYPCYITFYMLYVPFPREHYHCHTNATRFFEENSLTIAPVMVMCPWASYCGDSPAANGHRWGSRPRRSPIQTLSSLFPGLVACCDRKWVAQCFARGLIGHPDSSSFS